MDVLTQFYNDIFINNNVFSTREYAVAIWLFIFLVAVLFSSGVRNSLANIIRLATGRKIVLPFFIILIYGAFITKLFSMMSIWKWMFLKDIIIWIILVGVPFCYNAVSENEKGYFKNAFLNNLKLIAVIQFISNAYSFHISIEIILIPLVTLLVIIEVMVPHVPETQSLEKPIKLLSSFLGLFVLYFAFKKAIRSWGIDDGGYLLITFSIPVVYSILFIPIAYCCAVYSQYEIIFLKLRFRGPKDKRLKKLYKWKIMKACKLSLTRIKHFKKKYLMRINTEDIEGVLKKFQSPFMLIARGSKADQKVSKQEPEEPQEQVEQETSNQVEGVTSFDHKNDSKEVHKSQIGVDEIKEIITHFGLGEGDRLIEATLNREEIKAIVKLGPHEFLELKDLAILRFSITSDALFDRDGWDVLTLEYEGVGSVSINKSEKETNEYGEVYFPTAVIMERLK